jgi:replicative DNA helicase
VTEHKRLRAVPPLVAGRAPPADLDAEAAVLSAILLDRDALETVQDLLVAEQFYATANATVYATALELAGTGQPVDIVTVGAVLRERQRLDAIGGMAYLAQLSDATPAVAHVEAHAAIVRERWRVRSLIATCQRAASEGYCDVGPVQPWIDTLESEVHSLAQSVETRAGQYTRDALPPVWSALSAAAERGSNVTGLATGHTRIDELTGGMERGDFWIVAGRPSMGKTAYADWLAMNVAATPFGDERIGVAFFTLEMPREQQLRRMIFAEARVELGRVRTGMLRADDWSRLTEASNLVAALSIWIDDAPGLTPLGLRSKVRRVQSEMRRSGVRLGLVVVDHIGLMRVDRQAHSREQEVSEISKSFKELAKECELAVLGLSQLNRQVEMRGVKDKRPTLADLRDSGSLEQDADTVLFVYRDDYYDRESKRRGIAEILVSKQRNGPTGRAYARWTAGCTRFDNIDIADVPDVSEDS